MSRFLSKVTEEEKVKIVGWIQKNPDSTILETQCRWTISRALAQTLRREAKVGPEPAPFSARAFKKLLPKEGGPRPLNFRNDSK